MRVDRLDSMNQCRCVIIRSPQLVITRRCGHPADAEDMLCHRCRRLCVSAAVAATIVEDVEEVDLADLRPQTMRKV
jgi:hypothetical protein